MSVVIYMTGSGMQVVDGNKDAKKPQVTQAFTIDIPAHMIEGGMVKQEKEFVELVKNFWQENKLANKNVTLVINSKVINNSFIKVPSDNDKKLYGYVKAEMDSVIDENDTVCAYRIMQKGEKPQKKKTPVKKEKENKTGFYAGMERPEGMEEKQEDEETTIDTFHKIVASVAKVPDITRMMYLFYLADIEITSVQSGGLNMVSVVSDLPQIVDKNCIVQIYESGTLMNLLFVKGQYYYSTTSIIVQEPGTIGYAIEVARSVSGLLQFIKASGVEASDITVFLVGMEMEDVVNCTDSITQMNSQLEVDYILEENFVTTSIDAREHIYAATGLLTAGKTLDMYPYLKKAGKIVEGEVPLKQMMKPAFVLAAVLAVVTIGVEARDVYINQSLKKVDAYNQSMVERAAEYDEMENKVNYNNRCISEVETLKENIASYPYADSRTEKIILNTAEGYVNAKVVSYDAATGLYSISTMAPDVETISQYIDKLRKLDILEEVDYSGYSYLEDSNCWQVNVLCYLSENAGKEN